MSDTDDTDDLLLIPPDFFTIDAELEAPGPYYDVVDSLIQQVNKLEHRINFIENTSDASIVSKSLEFSSPKSDLMSGVRKYNSSDDIRKISNSKDIGCYFESTQSTPQKPRQTRFRLNSLDSSPSLSSQQKFTKQYKSPSKYVREYCTMASGDPHKEEILQEIDEFISNTHTLKCSNSINSNERLSLNDVNHMLKQIENQEKEFDSDKPTSKQRTWQCGDNKTSVPDYGYGIRNMMYANQNEANKQPPSTSDLSTIYTDSLAEKTESVSSSSESTQVTALPNVNASSKQQTDFQHKVASHEPRRVRRNILQNDVSNKTSNAEDNSRRLLSLSYLWKRNDGNQKFQTLEVSLSQKLEEEKLRRQHCEQLIQNLQLRVLELQERLAVALQVDEAKDDAILRFHKAWEQVAVRLQCLTRERDELEKEICEINNANTNNIAEATKKISHFENEASKALNLAHSSQEKLNVLEKRCSDLTSENEELLKKISTLNSDSEIEIGKASRLTEIITEKDAELNENQKILANAQNEIAQSKRAVELCQVELTTMKTQYTHLEFLLNEKQDAIKNLESQNRKLAAEIDTHKKIERDLQQELNKAKELNEKNKIDLRNFYQDQVEIVVREKLKEFQSQLDKAESSLHEEMKKRELAIAKTAAVHIQQITEKHSTEVQLLEEKHNEEIRLYQIQLSQVKQHLENLQHRFQEQQQRKSEMAQQLHKVMEAQWLEALKIINNGRSPIVSQDPDVTLNQLNILKSKSHSNLEEVLSMDLKRNAADLKPNKKEVDIPPLNLGPSTSSYNDDVRSMLFFNETETPLSSRPRTKQQIENELQKYVQMLLNKSPGNPVVQEATNNGNQWLSSDDNKARAAGLKDRRQKPPWK